MARNTTYLHATLAAATIAMVFGCSTAPSSAPFHMYTSPLLEGEMEPPRSNSSSASTSQIASPGVEPRQVYVYQRWHSDEVATTAPSQRAGKRPGPRLDTVEPAAEPVLPDFNPNQATGAGRTVDDDGAGPNERPTAPQSSESRSGERGPAAVKAQPTTNSPNQATFAAQFTHTILKANGISFSAGSATSVPDLYRECRTEGDTFQSNRPTIGDLVFFHNTFDANQDGRNNNWYTMVGVIEHIGSDGTVQFVTHRGEEIETHSLNLDELNEQHGAGGRTINSKLRTKTDRDPPYTQYLAGQLFAGFCNILGDRDELLLLDQWSPDMEL